MKLLEQIVGMAYKAALPIRLADTAVKFSYDAVAATATKFGIDRFDLARYTAIGTGAALFVAAGAYIAVGYITLSFASTVAGIGAGALASMASKYRDYLLTPKDVLSESYEEGVQIMKFLRFPLLTFGAVVPTLLATNNNLGLTGNLFFTSRLVGMSSYMYLADGDHSLWDKAKVFLSNLIPRSSSLNRGPATSYG